MEIAITICIVVLAVFIFYRSAKKKTSGDCDCGNCSNHCPLYDEKKGIKYVKK